MFMHGGFWHLAGNMLYLWIFGNNIEDAMGHVRFFIFYVLCGVAAVFAQVLPNPDSQIPMVGASGAISGVLGAYMLLFPARARVVRAAARLPDRASSDDSRRSGCWRRGSSCNSSWAASPRAQSAGESQGGIAFGAHIGGFIAGLALVAFFKRRDVPLWRRY